MLEDNTVSLIAPYRKEVNFATSNDSFIEVDEEGNHVAIYDGTATITVMPFANEEVQIPQGEYLTTVSTTECS